MAAIRVLFLIFFLSADADAVVRRHFGKWEEHTPHHCSENPAAGSVGARRKHSYDRQPLPGLFRKTL
jgi:hypothetical protein